MGLRINTNVQSLLAQRHFGINSSAQKDSLEHLASGTRINKAADDAAGLAISEKMNGQIRSIRQDVRNANDGISMIQTAEGGMNEIGNILTRFRELSIQAASDTIGDTERGFIDKEVQQLKQEVNRIASTVEFNGRKILGGGDATIARNKDGEPVDANGEKLDKDQADAAEARERSGAVLDIQVGTHNNAMEDRFVFDQTKINVSLDKLGLNDLSTVDKESARANLDAVDKAVTSLTANRAELGALQNRIQSTINNLNVYDENLSAANSRIRDTDMAAETAQLAKTNILTQAGISVLSQANQNSMMALKLLG